MSHHKDRKDRLEQVLDQAYKASQREESSVAWQRLCRELHSMTEPEANIPRFNELLRALWVAATNEQNHTNGVDPSNASSEAAHA